MTRDKNIHSSLTRIESEGLQLPASCYTDSAYHNLETKTIFAAGWMAIGFESNYLESNRSWSLEVLGKPLLITRDSENTLRIFENVCRHRGHLLLDERTKPGKLLSCPYHAWCYSLDGQFVKAPYWEGSKESKPTDSQKSAMGLIPVCFAVWYDLVFVNFSKEAEPFDDFIAPLQARWSDRRPMDQLRRFSDKDFVFQGNWKLAAENFLDNYHLPWVHPEIGSSIEGSLGAGVGLENLLLSDNIIGFSHPTAGADKGKTDMPLPAWPKLGAAEEQRQDLFFVFPNTCLVMEGYYLWSMIILPNAVDSLDEKLALYVVGDEAMQPEFDNARKQLADLIYKVNSQDEIAVRNLQKGRQSDAASSGVYCDYHDQLGKWFHQSVARKMLSNVDIGMNAAIDK